MSRHHRLAQINRCCNKDSVSIPIRDFWRRSYTLWSEPFCRVLGYTSSPFLQGLEHTPSLVFQELNVMNIPRSPSSSIRLKQLLFRLFLSPVDVFGPTEIFRDRIVSVAVPAKELFFAWRPGEVFVSARALRRVIDRGTFLFFFATALTISQRILSRTSLEGFELLSNYRNEGWRCNIKSPHWLGAANEGYPKRGTMGRGMRSNWTSTRWVTYHD